MFIVEIFGSNPFQNKSEKKRAKELAVKNGYDLKTIQRMTEREKCFYTFQK